LNEVSRELRRQFVEFQQADLEEHVVQNKADENKERGSGEEWRIEVSH